MIRKTLTILSLIGLVVSVGLWAVSYHGLGYSYDGAAARTPGEHFVLREIDVSLINGTLLYDQKPTVRDFEAYGVYGRVQRPRHVWIDRRTLMVMYEPGGWDHFSGFHQLPSIHFDEIRGLYLIAPLWLPSLLFAGAFAWLFVPLYRCRKRKRLGLCVKCAYDLRGSTDHCPECGAPVKR